MCKINQINWEQNSCVLLCLPSKAGGPPWIQSSNLFLLSEIFVYCYNSVGRVVGGSWCDQSRIIEASASINTSFYIDILKMNNMSIPPMAEMLLRNKEPSVTKNQDFPWHLPSKEGTNTPLQDSSTVLFRTPTLYLAIYKQACAIYFRINAIYFATLNAIWYKSLLSCAVRHISCRRHIASLDISQICQDLYRCGFATHSAFF